MAEQDRGRGTGSLLHALKAIAWAFFGVRGKRAHEGDLERLKPGIVIGVGLLMAAVFIGTLVVLANLAAG